MSNPTTVCALINRSITSSGNQVFFGPQANGQDNWMAINGNILQLFGTQTSDINNFSIPGNTFISSSRWYFVTGIINGPTASIYLNGNLERSTTQSFNIGGWGGSARIGSRGTTQFPFPGQISNVQAYNKALSQTEILQNYYQSPIVTNGLVTALDAGNLVSYESGSTILYSLTGSLSGSLINGTGYSNVNGGNWVFDGIDDYIFTQPNSGINSIYTNNQLTIQAWFNYQDSGSFRNIMGILRNGDPTFLSFGWRVPPSNNVFFDSVIHDICSILLYFSCNFAKSSSSNTIKKSSISANISGAATFNWSGDCFRLSNFFNLLVKPKIKESFISNFFINSTNVSISLRALINVL
jgi:hypothetical protein